MQSFLPTDNDILDLERMANPLKKISKIKGKSWEELRTRGEQAFSIYSEQIGLTGKMPTDAEFVELIDKSAFGKSPIIAESLWVKFFKNGDAKFFPSFARRKETNDSFRKLFGEKSAAWFIDKASKIIEGRFDLLGFLNLDLGPEIDWHYEPISGKRSPLKHWKQFDELDTAETGDKKVIWELNRHQHFFTLGIAYWLTKDERYAATFTKHLETWMEQNPPGTGINWFSSMELAFRVMSWTWGIHFFRDSESFTPELFQKTLKFLHMHGRHIEKYLSTYYSPNTHLTGEALGLYYLGTQFPFFERSKYWRKLGEDILIAELDRQILADGVYFEQSTWYQRYTADFYTHFLILKTLFGDEIEAETANKLEAKLQSVLDFLMYVTRPDGTTPIIGDDDGGRMLPFGRSKSDDFRSALVTGAALFERGDYKHVSGGEPKEEILWLLGWEGVQAYKTLRSHVPHETSYKFPAGGYFVMRDGWTESDNYLLVDCGEVGAVSGGHGHADTLAIDLAIEGKTLLVDSGTYTYHESRDLRNYFRSTTAHNTLVIDKISSSEPGDKFSWKTRADAKIDSLISQERFDYFQGSHNGYERIAGAPATHNRSILFLKNDYWIVRDFVETKGDHDYALNFHLKTGIHPVIEASESGNFCVGEVPTNEDGWRFFTFGDNGAWQRKESWSSVNYGEKVNSPFLRYVSKGKGAQEFYTFMLPVGYSDKAPEVYETPVPGGRAFVVDFRGYMDLIVVADPGEIVRTEIFNSNFRVLWARMTEGQQLPEEFVLVGGTHFTLGDREVINHPNEIKYATARRFGNKLNVRTSDGLFSVSIPQRKSQTYIMKNSEEV